MCSFFYNLIIKKRKGETPTCSWLHSVKFWEHDVKEIKIQNVPLCPHVEINKIRSS